MSQSTSSIPERIHPTAIIDPAATLHESVEVGPYSVIGPNVVLGKETKIGPHVFIEGYTEIGEQNRIFHGAAIGSAPQDFSYLGEKSYVRIGHRNTIREFVTIQPGSEAGSVTSIGDDNLLMAYVHVAHNCRLESRTVLANAVNLAGYVSVEDFAIIGGITPIHQFVRIGRHAIVGAARASRRTSRPTRRWRAILRKPTDSTRSACPVAGSPRRA